jgi:hypothetical protein
VRFAALRVRLLLPSVRLLAAFVTPMELLDYSRLIGESPRSIVVVPIPSNSNDEEKRRRPEVNICELGSLVLLLLRLPGREAHDRFVSGETL